MATLTSALQSPSPKARYDPTELGIFWSGQLLTHLLLVVGECVAERLDKLREGLGKGGQVAAADAAESSQHVQRPHALADLVREHRSLLLARSRETSRSRMTPFRRSRPPVRSSMEATGSVQAQ
jgi:hypothetical protein